MIDLDANGLARYNADDQADAESRRQRVTARRLIASGRPMMNSEAGIDFADALHHASDEDCDSVARSGGASIHRVLGAC